MSNKGQLLQDPFLNALRKEHVPVSIYLVNGLQTRNFNRRPSTRSQPQSRLCRSGIMIYPAGNTPCAF